MQQADFAHVSADEFISDTMPACNTGPEPSGLVAPMRIKKIQNRRSLKGEQPGRFAQPCHTQASAARIFSAFAARMSLSAISPVWGLSETPSKRGMIWTWVWNTTCPPAGSENC